MTPSAPRRSHEDEGEDDRGGRALWKGILTFGLVEIPVALHSAVSRKDSLSFSLLDRRDLAPVGYERVNKSTGKTVAWDDIVRGYEHAPQEFVVLSDEEIRGANPEASQTIAIVDFVNGAEIDSVYWETPYYVEPASRGKSRAYALLREALRRSGRVGIAQVVIRTRQRLAAVTVRGEVLVLNVLRYAYELRDPADVSVPASRPEALGIRPKEISLAESLVESMSTAWDPKAYEDRYRSDVLALVKKKVAAGRSKEIEKPAVARDRSARGEVLDLMPLLERSMRTRPAGRVQIASASRRRAARPATRKRPA